MDGADAPRCGEAAPARAAASRRRVSTRREAVFVALWAALFALFVVAYLRLGAELWAGSRGVAVFVVLVLVAVLFSIASARTRTVRLRSYRFVEGVAGFSGAVGAGIAGQVLGVSDGNEVSTGTALLAALVLSAPLLGCAVWLGARSR